MTFRYRLILKPDDNGTIVVTSPDFPLATYGDDESSAIANAVNAVESLFASMMEAKEDLPQTRDEADISTPRLRLPLQTALKAELYTALRAAGLTRADLQRRLGWQRESVDRLFRINHKSKIEQIDEAFKALGREVTIEVAA